MRKTVVPRNSMWVPVGGEPAISSPGVGAAEGPEDGDWVVLGDGLDDRHADIRKCPELPAYPALIYIERSVAVNAVVAEVGLVYLSGDFRAALVEDLLEHPERDSTVAVRKGLRNRNGTD